MLQNALRVYIAIAIVVFLLSSIAMKPKSDNLCSTLLGNEIEPVEAKLDEFEAIYIQIKFIASLQIIVLFRLLSEKFSLKAEFIASHLFWWRSAACVKLFPQLMCYSCSS